MLRQATQPVDQIDQLTRDLVALVYDGALTFDCRCRHAQLAFVRGWQSGAIGHHERLAKAYLAEHAIADLRALDGEPETPEEIAAMLWPESESAQ